MGIKSSGFSARVQGVVDDASEMERAGLLELRFTVPHFGVWLAGSFADLELNEVTSENSTNWKVGGYYHFGKLTFGLQYEDAEIGTLDNNPEGGAYILGSLDFTKNNVTIAGWVAGYLSDIEDRMLDEEGKPIEEDALSWAIGAKYHFSKRTQIYGGYRETNSDNDFRDENVATFGIRHVF
ncbi:Porin, Gram-negative type [Candidatus Thiomargarita nelsonii]|uniref:Porin, Gram-negative type n=1 Tax=Candidatus Thiomargarita nelsonii TaxID=1003181 RepID=A0A176S2N9_9GAMM|nr:Porin, Gram-negative type [Candidatus Thiomargarita nelsonii]